MNRLLSEPQARWSLAAWLAAVALWLIFAPHLLHLIDTLAMETVRAL